MNAAEKIITEVHECSCGRFYASPEGVAACRANGHGSGKDKFGDRLKFMQEVEHEYTAECAECGERLRFRVTRVTPLRTCITVVPHVCQISDGEV